MSTYPQRVADNILPLSQAETLPEAFGEWYFTGITEDHEQAIEECELCNQEQLRYHFKIKNKNTHKHLWIGSQCIIKFKVAVFEDDRLLDEKETKKKLNSLIKKMRFTSCMNALRQLAQKENHNILDNALDFYQKNKYLTPKLSFVIFWRLKSHGIDHSPSFFKVSLKRDKYKNDLREMEPHRVHLIWPALTSSQRKLALSMGHSAPP
ncbi:hypothetical protein [Thiolapillus sp.]|uniref:hypothetical protein n=9 Tax=Thiolapillus sp. TaxID=2017437 RepID=UPI0025FF0798|nr:hypothetical protein [Thiolapillus sp.]